MGKQDKKKVSASGSASGRGEKPYKKHPKVFDAARRRLVSKQN